MEEKEKQGCLKELKRLKRHYKKEYKQMMANLKEKKEIGLIGWQSGVVDGLDLAIEVLENSEFYGR